MEKSDHCIHKILFYYYCSSPTYILLSLSVKIIIMILRSKCGAAVMAAHKLSPLLAVPNE